MKTLLRSALRKSGLSLREAARQAELDKATVSRWMHGQRRPDLGALLKLGQVLAIPSARLIDAHAKLSRSRRRPAAPRRRAS